MEKIIILAILKYKIFLYWLITGGLLHAFEVQAGNTRFNIWKFIMSSVIFWFLTEFSHLLIQWDFITTDTTNESRVIVLSIMVAALLYLFLPFILAKNNRAQFIESLLNRFWFYQTNNNKKW